MKLSIKWCNRVRSIMALALATILVAGSMLPQISHAAQAAATLCPPSSFVNNTNLAKNASFETVGPKGSPTSWQNGNPLPAPSAAQDWLMHSNNAHVLVTSELVPTTVPGPGDRMMLHFVAGGNEGGIYQPLQAPPAKLMFSVWVFVKRGHVAIQPNGGNQGPGAWSTKLNEWEQLRVCTDGSILNGTDMLVIYIQDPAGGDFFVDRVEVLQTP